MIQNRRRSIVPVYILAVCLQKILQMELKERIEEVWGNRELLKNQKYTDAIRAVI